MSLSTLSLPHSFLPLLKSLALFSISGVHWWQSLRLVPGGEGGPVKGSSQREEAAAVSCSWDHQSSWPSWWDAGMTHLWPPFTSFEFCNWSIAFTGLIYTHIGPLPSFLPPVIALLDVLCVVLKCHTVSVMLLFSLCVLPVHLVCVSVLPSYYSFQLTTFYFAVTCNGLLTVLSLLLSC